MRDGVVVKDKADFDIADSEFGSASFVRNAGEATLSVDLKCQSDAEARARFLWVLEQTCPAWRVLADTRIACTAGRYASEVSGRCGR